MMIYLMLLWSVLEVFGIIHGCHDGDGRSFSPRDEHGSRIPLYQAPLKNAMQTLDISALKPARWEWKDLFIFL